MFEIFEKLDKTVLKERRLKHRATRRLFTKVKRNFKIDQTPAALSRWNGRWTETFRVERRSGVRFIDPIKHRDLFEVFLMKIGFKMPLISAFI